LRGPPRILEARGHSFSDVARKVVSIINLASVAAIAGLIGRPVDPLRFRGNLYVEGWPAFGELDLVGREIAIGSARGRIINQRNQKKNPSHSPSERLGAGNLGR